MDKNNIFSRKSLIYISITIVILIAIRLIYGVYNMYGESIYNAYNNTIDGFNIEGFNLNNDTAVD